MSGDFSTVKNLDFMMHGFDFVAPTPRGQDYAVTLSPRSQGSAVTRLVLSVYKTQVILKSKEARSFFLYMESFAPPKSDLISKK